MTIGFAMCGSFCTYEQVFPVMEALALEHTVIPVFSFAAWETDSRFGTAESHIKRANEICASPVLHTIAQAEPIGPKKLLDALIIAPCTGNTLAKLAHSIADTPVTMAAKSHLRNGRPVIVAISTNDALAGAITFLYPSGRTIRKRNPPALLQTFRKFLRLWMQPWRADKFSLSFWDKQKPADIPPAFILRLLRMKYPTHLRGLQLQPIRPPEAS